MTEKRGRDRNLELRRDLFYAVCRIIEGSYSDPAREAEFRRQKAALAERLGYGPEPKRLTPEYQLSPKEFRRMKAAIRYSMKPARLRAIKPQKKVQAATFFDGIRGNVTVMKNNPVVPEQTPPVPHKRFVLNIGGEKIALDFGAKLTELKPEPAEVIPIDKGKRPRRLKTK